MLYVLYFALAVYMITRFGRRIAASRALPVWLVLIALGVIVVDPDLLLPVAGVFGVQVVSNLVFATLIVFLMFETLAGAAEGTGLQRRVRILVARLAAREYRRPEGKAGALVVVPAYNESASIAALVSDLAALRAQTGVFDVLIVDDGSVDDTAAIARAAAGPGVSVVSHAVNCNVGGVLLTGFTAALAHGYRWVVQCDGDGQHPVEQIPELLRRADERGLDLLVGSRFVDRAQRDSSTTALRRSGGRMISWALATFGSAARATDPTSGFRVFSRSAAALLVQKMPDEYPEPESIAVCALEGLRVGEVAVQMNQRTGGSSSISGWRSAIFMMKVLTSLLSFRVRALFGRPG